MDQTLTAPRSRTVPKLSLRGEFGRKSFHLGSVVFPIALYHLGSEIMLPVLAILAALSVAVEILRARHAALNALMLRLVGGIMRHHERGTEPGRVVLTGSTWMLLAYTLVLLFFSEPVAIAAFLMTTFCDVAAAVVGRCFGRVEIANGRTLEGSAAFLAVGLLVAWATPDLAFGIAALGAAAAAVAEILTRRLDDNLVIPLVSGGVMSLTQMIAGA